MKKGDLNKVYIGVGIVVLILVLIFVFGGNSKSTVNVNSNSNPSISAAAGQVKEFTMTAKQFEFVPGKITVNTGDTVILHITSTDVTHGIAIPQFGVNQRLPVGEEKTVKFVADKKGTYNFYCSVYCGPGHRSMIGELVVQ